MKTTTLVIILIIVTVSGYLIYNSLKNKGNSSFVSSTASLDFPENKAIISDENEVSRVQQLRDWFIRNMQPKLTPHEVALVA